MRIDMNLLDKYGACEQGKKYMARFYPDGAECIDLIHDKHLPIDFLHWGFKMLPASKEEIAAYHERVELKNCSGVYECRRCENSESLISCSDVKNSRMIFTSDDVSDSLYVMGSSHIRSSQHIYFSNQMDDCEAAYQCKSLVGCSAAYGASYSKNSYGLAQCEFCFNSRNLISCKQMESCEFCVDCANLTNCIFCYGITEGENLIFNKPAPTSVIEMAKTEFGNLGHHLLNLCDEWCPPYLNLAPKMNIDPRQMFANFPAELWEFVKKLPNFDAQLLYNMTFLEQFI